jgi:predicted neuraminidase
LLLVYNDSMSDRSPLTMAISTDQGKTFPHRRNLAEGEGSFSYPTAIQAADGKLHIAFTSDERTVVNHAVLTEEEILNP